MAHAEPIQGLSFFSTDGGQKAPRAAGHIRPPLLARSDIKGDANIFIQKLRARWPHVCNAIFAPWDIRWFFDEYDFHLHGGRFLYEKVLMKMTRENEEKLIRCSQSWSEANKSNFHVIMTLGIDKAFHEKDHIEYGAFFLQKALEHMRAAYQRALNFELLGSALRRNSMLAMPFVPSSDYSQRTPRVRSEQTHYGGQRRAASGHMPNPSYHGTAMLHATPMVQWAPTSQMHGHLPYPDVGVLIPVRGADGMIPGRGMMHTLPGPPPGSLFDPHSDSTPRGLGTTQFQGGAPYYASNLEIAKRSSKEGLNVEQTMDNQSRGRTYSGSQGRNYKKYQNSRKSSMSFNDNDNRILFDGGGSISHRKMNRRPTLDRINDGPEPAMAPIHGTAQVTPKNKPRPADIIVPGRDVANKAQGASNALTQRLSQLTDLPPNLRVTTFSIGGDVNNIFTLYPLALGGDFSDQEVHQTYRHLPGFESATSFVRPAGQSPNKQRLSAVHFRTTADARHALRAFKDRRRFALQVPKQHWTHDSDGNRLNTGHQFENPDRNAWNSFRARVSETTSPTKSKKFSKGRKMSQASREHTGSSGPYSPQDVRSDLWPAHEASTDALSPEVIPPTPESALASGIPAPKLEKHAAASSPTRDTTAVVRVNAQNGQRQPVKDRSTAADVLENADVGNVEKCDAGKLDKTDADIRSGERATSDKASGTAISQIPSSISQTPGSIPGPQTPSDIAGLQTPSRSSITGPQLPDEPKPANPTIDPVVSPKASLALTRGSIARALKIVPALPRSFQDLPKLKSAAMKSPAKLAKDSSSETTVAPSDTLSKSHIGGEDLEKKTSPTSDSVSNGQQTTGQLVEPTLTTADVMELPPIKDEVHTQVAHVPSSDHSPPAPGDRRERAQSDGSTTDAGTKEIVQVDTSALTELAENASPNLEGKHVMQHVRASDSSAGATSLDIPSTVSTPVEPAQRHSQASSKRSSNQWPNHWRGQYEEIKKMLPDLQHESVKEWSEEAEKIRNALDSLDQQMREDEAKLADQSTRTLGKNIKRRMKKRTDDHAQQGEEMYLLLGMVHSARISQDAADKPKPVEEKALSLKAGQIAKRYPTHEASASMPYARPRDANQESSLIARESMDGTTSVRFHDDMSRIPRLLWLMPHLGPDEDDTSKKGRSRGAAGNQGAITGRVVEDVTDDSNSPPNSPSTQKSLSLALSTLFRNQGESSGNDTKSGFEGLGLLLTDTASNAESSTKAQDTQATGLDSDQQPHSNLISPESLTNSSESTLDEDGRRPNRARTGSEPERIVTPGPSEGDQGDQDDRHSFASYASAPTSPSEVKKAQDLLEALIKDSKIQATSTDEGAGIDDSGQHEAENVRPSPSRTTSTPGQMSYARAAVNTSSTPATAPSPAAPAMSLTPATLIDSAQPTLARRLSASSQHSNSSNLASNQTHKTPQGKGKARAISPTKSDTHVPNSGSGPIIDNGNGKGKGRAGEHFPIGPDGAWYSSPSGPAHPPSAWRGLPKDREGAQGRKVA